MNTKLFLVLSTAVSVLAATAAPAATYNNEVDVGVLVLFIGNINGRYERNINDYVAVVAGAGYMPHGYVFIPDEERDKFEYWRITTINGAVKFFPLGDFRRLYFQGEINVDIHSVEEFGTGATGSATAYRPGAVVGWRWVIAERATLTVGAGSDYLEIHARAGETEGTLDGIWPRLDFNLGFLF